MGRIRFQHAIAIVCLTIMVLFSECSEPTITQGFSFGPVWSIPRQQVIDGGVGGQIGIPGINSPEFVSVDQIDYLEPLDFVIGFKVGDDVRAYPHRILDWHEIINDEVGNQPVAINYCPLTGTAMAWSRDLDGTITTFDNSGLLYNSNLLALDTETGTIFSQMLNRGVNGDLIDEPTTILQTIETTWETWQALYPQSRVMTTNTGFERDYNRYPLGSYRQDNGTLWPVSRLDDRLFTKERVLGVVIEGEAKIYRFINLDPDGELAATRSTGVIEDIFNNQRLMVVGNGDVMAAYSPGGVSGATTFTPVSGRLPVALTDNLGNEYDLYGEVINGPNRGERLEQLEAYIGFFFSWGAFFPTPQIYGAED